MTNYADIVIDPGWISLLFPWGQLQHFAFPNGLKKEKRDIIQRSVLQWGEKEIRKKACTFINLFPIYLHVVMYNNYQ